MSRDRAQSALKLLSRLAYRACGGDHEKLAEVDEAVAVLDDLVSPTDPEGGGEGEGEGEDDPNADIRF